MSGEALDRLTDALAGDFGGVPSMAGGQLSVHLVIDSPGLGEAASLATDVVVATVQLILGVERPINAVAVHATTAAEAGSAISSIITVANG